MSDNRNRKANDSSDSDKGSSLFKAGKEDDQVRADLRAKYPNDKELVNKLFGEYESQMRKVKRKASKFAQLVLTKYSGFSPTAIIEKAKKLKKKYGFSDDEFTAFINYAFGNKMFNEKNMFNTKNTRVAKTLGYDPTENSAKLSVSTEDLPILQNILKTHQMYSNLHQQVIVQSLLYQGLDASYVHDFNVPASGGVKFEKTIDNMMNYIHPLIIALFFPRNSELDEQMLMASISNIVALRNNNMSVKDRPTLELLNAMVTDPNEMVCYEYDNKTSPIKELQNRVNVQVALWKCVHSMRNKKFWPADNTFLTAVSNCRQGLFDSVDSLYLSDEGAVLRRLLGAFSYRPTYVGITAGLPTMSGVASSTFSYPVQTLGMNQVTNVPVINIQLGNPTIAAGTAAGASAGAVSLLTSLTSSDTYIQNKQMVSRSKRVLFNKQMLFFYVNRRYQQIDYTRINQVSNMTVLPISSFGFEKINRTLVSWQQTVGVGSDNFELQSFIAIETAPIPANVTGASSSATSNYDYIIGSSAVVALDGNAWAKYDPSLIGYKQNVGQTVYDFFKLDSNIKSIQTNTNATLTDSVLNMFQECGTIYIYKKN